MTERCALPLGSGSLRCSVRNDDEYLCLSRCSARNLEQAHGEILLAELEAIMAQDVVSGDDVEIEVRHRDAHHIFRARQRQLDLRSEIERDGAFGSAFEIL